MNSIRRWLSACSTGEKAWDEHGAGILEGFTRFKESLRELWDTIYENIIKPIFDRIAGTVSWLWDKHLKPLWDKLTDFFGSVAEFLLALWNERIKPVVDFIVTTVGPVVSHVVGTIGDVVGTVIGVVSDVIGGILEALGGLMDFLTGVFTGDWEKAWSGIQQFFKGIWDGIWGIVKGIVNLIIDGLNLLWGAIYSVVAGIVNGIGGIAEVDRQPVRAGLGLLHAGRNRLSSRSWRRAASRWARPWRSSARGATGRRCCP